MAASDNPKNETPVGTVSTEQREIQLQVPRSTQKRPELHDKDGNQR